MAETTSDVKVEQKSWKDFLESTPPYTVNHMTGMYVQESGYQKIYWIVASPILEIYCGSAACGGTRYYNCISPAEYKEGAGKHAFFMEYSCRNCNSAETRKVFSILAWRKADNSADGSAVKLGELPPFGPPTPARVIRLIQPDRELFLKGRRSENQGLGIGAFAYYRRIVENQKNRIIDQMAKVAARLGADEQTLRQFDQLKIENQFSKVIDEIKDSFPSVLLIQGHNPLKLLHSALSEGIHAQSDDECLALAAAIRLILTELADRMDQALKDESELKQALSKLLNPKQNPPPT